MFPFICFLNLDINQSIPIVAWTQGQESGLQTETFMMLLHKLGFHLAADVGKLFPRIPYYWTADHIYHMVQKLGPVKQDLKMDLVSILESTNMESPTFPSEHSVDVSKGTWASTKW